MSEENNKAGVLALIFSFLFPIVGVICYFVKKNDVVNPNAYLQAALVGFVVGLILNFVCL